jgi:prevent-host-death family protein
MKQLNLYQARTHLSALVEQASRGEEIWIAKNGRLRARLMPLTSDDANTVGEGGDNSELKPSA